MVFGIPRARVAPDIKGHGTSQCRQKARPRYQSILPISLVRASIAGHERVGSIYTEISLVRASIAGHERVGSIYTEISLVRASIAGHERVGGIYTEMLKGCKKFKVNNNIETSLKKKEH